MKQRLQNTNIPDSVVQSLAGREAALWIGPDVDPDDQNVELLRDLCKLPWQCVLCESASGKLARALDDSSSADDRLRRQRGFVHVVAADPENLELPPRALPIYFLNGRNDADRSEESSERTKTAMLRRRLNMINRLEIASPRHLVVVSTGAESPISDVIDLWEGGFRALLVVVSDSATDSKVLDEWLTSSSSPPAIDHCLGALAPTIADLVERVESVLPEGRLVVHMRHGRERPRAFDITECELPEQPLLDRYELIQVRDTSFLQPDDLSLDDIRSFFDRSSVGWRAYAAGLPWQRDHGIKEKLLKALGEVESRGPDANSIQVLASERGAGGTTAARTLALEAAREGYPTLVARSVKFQPESIELRSFLFRVHQRVLSQMREEEPQSSSEESGTLGRAPRQETPWLLVFDVQHWEGRQAEIPVLARALSRSGRPVVLLIVSGDEVNDALAEAQQAEVVGWIRHELTGEDARNLGTHLNQFLKPHGKAKAENEWRAFWDKHRPTGMQMEVTSFWIALEFWLMGQLDLTESVQEWVGRHFREAELESDVRVLLLEIAALSIERQPYPEGLLPPSPEGSFPYSFLLSEIRAEVPALALVCEGRPPAKQWAMAHDLLGRYLISSVYYDHSRLVELGFGAAEDPMHFRIMLLRRLATRKELGRRPFAPLAVEFAVNILKLGSDGNLEFSQYWKDVLNLLDDMPRSIWESSRIFNHHVAITRRRVATNSALFNLSLTEQRVQLTKAVEHIEFALYRLKRSEQDDESDLNLLNSVSLAYQNLADVEAEGGANEERIRELREKATDAARRAQQENPTNSYVLETCARNLIQNGKLYPDEAATMAAEALGYIYQALTQDRLLLREGRLGQLADTAIGMLHEARASKLLDSVCASGNPLGFVGKAWLILTEEEEDITAESLIRLPKEKIDAALRVLEDAPKCDNPVLLRFRYDLLSSGQPSNFKEQLALLEELQGAGFALPIQLDLEYAILLHQRNRHPAANSEFMHLRQKLLKEEIYVTVPKRLHWLLDENGKRRTCHARVVEGRDYRSYARVRELKDAVVPFVPQEFGKGRLGAGQVLTCQISFGAMGPFIKPATAGE